MEFDGKGVIVTGAATGIGRATSLLFGSEGARVVVVDRSETGAETADAITASGGAAAFIRGDVSDPSDVTEMVGEAANYLDGIDVLVNNAGIQRAGLVHEFEEDDWNDVMSINVGSCFLVCKYAVPLLRSRASIVNMASVAGLKGASGMSAYGASKGAIISFTKALAVELGPRKIRVNCVCPGMIDTPFNTPFNDFIGGLDERAKRVQSAIPLRREGMTAEVAEAVLFLASKRASYLTGHALVVDGGGLA